MSYVSNTRPDDGRDPFAGGILTGRVRPSRRRLPYATGLTRRAFVRDGAFMAKAAATAMGAIRTAPALAADASSKADGKGAASSASDVAASATKLSVYASFYPMADFAEKIGGDRVDVTCLVPAGTEPHDWEPATTDIKNLENADVLVYNGAGMEHWVDDTLKSLSNKDLVAIEASQGIKLREVTGGEEEGDEAAGDSAREASHTDPHVWVSPANARAELANIRDGLKQADPDGAADYDANYEKWAEEFENLDKEYAERLSAAPNKTIVVSHEAYGYLCDEFGLTQEPIEGLEADAEPDAKRMAEIADFVKENNVKVVFSEDLVSPKVAQTIADEAGVQMERLNPVEGLTDEELAAGEDYLSVMRDNLAKLVDALS